ncbi:MAG: helix-turn-helix domain-containing protein [Planctomycetes bacterium]|nr:helix-turn-helix domain-containing protein [Planctomycetota bacterium]
MIAENKLPDDEHDDSRLLTAGDLAKRLRVSLRQVRKLHSEALVPAPVRLGRSVRWRGSEVGKWIEAGCPSRETWETMQNGQRGSGN